MSDLEVVDFFSRFLNKSVNLNSEITLTSAQRIRVHGWLSHNQVDFNEQILSKKFTISDLIGGNIGQIEKLDEAKLSEGRSQAVASPRGNQGLSVGIDIQSISELFPNGIGIDPKSEQELSKIFTQKELSYAQSKHDQQSTLAGIFGAKEALIKAGSSITNFNELEVLPDASGKPQCSGACISISHSGDFAIAIAILHQEAATSRNMACAEDKVDVVSKRKIEVTSKDLLIICMGFIVFVLIFLLISR